MAVSVDQLRAFITASYLNNTTGLISPKSLRDGFYLVADIMDALDVQEAVDDLQQYLTAAEAAATQTGQDRAAVTAAVADMVGGTTGQVLVKGSNANYDYAWATLENAGDMLKVMYDPTGKNADAFSMANMVETASAKVMTGAERTKLGNIAPAATANSTDAVLLARANHTGVQPVSSLDGVNATAAELNFLAGAANHNLTTWREGTSLVRSLLAPATLKQLIPVRPTYSLTISADQTVNFAAIKAALPYDALVKIEAWGGGGSGGRNQLAAGGGGGAYMTRTLRLSEIADSVAIVIGQGGEGRTSNSSGAAGTNTTVNLGNAGIMTAYGGGGGGARSSSTGAAELGGGGGAFQAGSTGSAGTGQNFDFGGGNGAYFITPTGETTTSVNAENKLYGGAGGGGSRGSTIALAGQSVFGGNGGVGAGSSPTATSNGAIPGGGGGGTQGGTSGAGARGEVRIWI